MSVNGIIMMIVICAFLFGSFGYLLFLGTKESKE